MAVCNDQISGKGGNDADFTVSQGDSIVVSTFYNFVSGLIAGSTISSTQFVQGTAAQDADDHFIYNIATGALSFDADGTGAIAAL